MLDMKSTFATKTVGALQYSHTKSMISLIHQEDALKDEDFATFFLTHAAVKRFLCRFKGRPIRKRRQRVTGNQPFAGRRGPKSPGILVDFFSKGGNLGNTSQETEKKRN